MGKIVIREINKWKFWNLTNRNKFTNSKVTDASKYHKKNTKKVLIYSQRENFLLKDILKLIVF